MALGAIPEQGLHVASCFVHALFLTVSIYHTAFSLRNPVRVPIVRFDPHKHTVLSFRSGIALVLTAVAFGEFVYQLDNKIYPDSTTTASPIYYADQILTILAWASNACLTILMARNGAWLYFKVHTNMRLSNLSRLSFDSIHWSIDWLISRCTIWLMIWLIDWFVCSIDWLIRSIRRLIDWLIDRLIRPKSKFFSSPSSLRLSTIFLWWSRGRSWKPSKLCGSTSTSCSTVKPRQNNWLRPSFWPWVRCTSWRWWLFCWWMCAESRAGVWWSTSNWTMRRKMPWHFRGIRWRQRRPVWSPLPCRMDRPSKSSSCTVRMKVASIAENLERFVSFSRSIVLFMLLSIDWLVDFDLGRVFDRSKIVRSIDWLINRSTRIRCFVRLIVWLL